MNEALPEEWVQHGQWVVTEKNGEVPNTNRLPTAFRSLSSLIFLTAEVCPNLHPLSWRGLSMNP
jgi:hypothetical protein